MSAGPFDTARQVLDSIGYPGRPYPGSPQNELALLDACARAGVQLGEFDRCVIGQLGKWDSIGCAVIAGIILRAGDSS